MESKTIIKAVCEEFGVTLEMLKSKSRKSPLPAARNMCALFLVNQYSYTEIGLILNKDRTSVYNGLDKLKSELSVYADVKETKQRIEEKLGL